MFEHRAAEQVGLLLHARDAGTGAARIVLSTSQVKIGNTYFVKAAGFSPGEHLQFSWSGRTRGVSHNFPAADSGGTGWQQVYERDLPGHYTLTVKGLTSGRTATAELDVVTGTGATQLVLTTSQITIGDTFYATTWGFLPGENLQFSYSGPASGGLLIIPADSGGNMSITARWNTPGDFTIHVRGQTSGRTALAELRVRQPGN